ncbi:hypothetical protein [Lacticaseibacillus hulanensis]|nr:hypothetical protein [Lacticaseibacillus hulanensis]
MSKKQFVLGVFLGLVVTSAAYVANRLDLFHDDAKDYEEFEGR